jgi:hypothetical protein
MTIVASSHAMIFPIRRPTGVDTAIEKLRNFSTLSIEQQVSCPEIRDGSRCRFIMLRSWMADLAAAAPP